MIICKFFAQGRCKNGDSCNFDHGNYPNDEGHSLYTKPSFPAIDILKLNSDCKSAQVCTFFVRNACTKGDECRFSHPLTVPPLLQSHSDLNPIKSNLNQQAKSISQPPSDLRARVSCKFLSHPGGCQNNSCPYLHPVTSAEMGERCGPDAEANEDEDEDIRDNFTQSLLGASVYFDELGHIQKVSIPTDCSLACITGLSPEATPEAIFHVLRDLGFDVNIDCICMSPGATPSELKVTVKTEDPSFVNDLCAKLKDRRSNLSASSIPTQIKRTNCKKLHISWHSYSRFTAGDTKQQITYDIYIVREHEIDR